MPSALVTVKYIEEFVYPGDYRDFCETHCAACIGEVHSFHAAGDPRKQWRDPVFVKAKAGLRNPTLLNKILKSRPLEICQDVHLWMNNGHHRFIAALDLGFKKVPVDLRRR